MQENRISIREWQKRYKAGEFSSKARSVQCEAGWYDWFCRDEALAGRLKKLAPVIMGITEPFIRPLAKLSRAVKITDTSD